MVSFWSQLWFLNACNNHRFLSGYILIYVVRVVSLLLSELFPRSCHFCCLSFNNSTIKMCSWNCTVSMMIKFFIMQSLSALHSFLFLSFLHFSLHFIAINQDFCLSPSYSITLSHFSFSLTSQLYKTSFVLSISYQKKHF